MSGKATRANFCGGGTLAKQTNYLYGSTLAKQTKFFVLVLVMRKYHSYNVFIRLMHGGRNFTKQTAEQTQNRQYQCVGVPRQNRQNICVGVPRQNRQNIFVLVLVIRKYHSYNVMIRLMRGGENFTKQTAKQTQNRQTLMRLCHSISQLLLRVGT